MLDRSPVGEWELSFPDGEDLRRRFKDDEIHNILLVLSYSARTPGWPQ
jgi:hypothetical protein